MYIWPNKKRKKQEIEKVYSLLTKFIHYYSESEFLRKISRWGMKMGMEALYYALILYYVLMDNNVSMKNKMTIMGALGYLILPVDFISDFIPVLGFSDDAAFLSFAVLSVANSITPEIKDKARKRIEKLINKTLNPEIFNKMINKRLKQ